MLVSTFRLSTINQWTVDWGYGKSHWLVFIQSSAGSGSKEHEEKAPIDHHSAEMCRDTTATMRSVYLSPFRDYGLEICKYRYTRNSQISKRRTHQPSCDNFHLHLGSEWLSCNYILSKNKPHSTCARYCSGFTNSEIYRLMMKFEITS